MTGMDVGILGLSEADRMAQITYGQDFGSQRIVDILNDIKEINERMLKLNVDMDTRDALGMSRVPDMLGFIGSKIFVELVHAFFRAIISAKPYRY
jgi:hypothetical protein